MFALATRLSLPHIAQSTLIDFGKTHLGLVVIDGVKAKNMEEVTGVYAAALLRAMRHNVGPETEIKGPTGRWSTIRPTNWSGVSRDFDLDKWSVCASSLA